MLQALLFLSVALTLVALIGTAVWALKGTWFAGWIADGVLQAVVEILAHLGI